MFFLPVTGVFCDIIFPASVGQCRLVAFLRWLDSVYFLPPQRFPYATKEMVAVVGVLQEGSTTLWLLMMLLVFLSALVAGIVVFLLSLLARA